MDTTRTHWDPFGRTIPAQRHAVKPPRGALPIPGWLTPALFVLAIVGTVWLVWAGLFDSGGDAVLMPAVMIGVCIGAALLSDHLGKGQQSRLYRYFLAAERNGWSFRLAPAFVPGAPGLSGSRRRRAPGLDTAPGAASGKAGGVLGAVLEQAEAARRAEGTLSDTAPAELQAVYRAIPELFKPRPGQPVAATIEAEFWGETAGTALPVWLAAREIESDTTFAAKALKTDARGHTGDSGALLTMVAGYRLDRDTGIRAALLAEALGDSRNDIKTESIAFNTRFHIALRDPDDPEGGLKLLQALTPATQTSLLDLAARYQVQVVIDGACVFVGGYERFNTRDPETLARLLAEASAAFAHAATAFKRYVE